MDQGYAFKCITHLQNIESMPGLAYATPAERRELLQEVMLQNESSADVEKIDDDMFSSKSSRPKGGSGTKGARRTAGMLSDLSGGQDMAYVEYNKSKNKELKSKHKSLFGQMVKAQHKRKADRAANA